VRPLFSLSFVTTSAIHCSPWILQFGIVVVVASLNALLSVPGVPGLADMGTSLSELTVVLSILFLSGVILVAAAEAGFSLMRSFSSAAQISSRSSLSLFSPVYLRYVARLTQSCWKFPLCFGQMT